MWSELTGSKKFVVTLIALGAVVVHAVLKTVAHIDVGESTIAMAVATCAMFVGAQGIADKGKEAAKILADAAAAQGGAAGAAAPSSPASPPSPPPSKP